MAGDVPECSCHSVVQPHARALLAQLERRPTESVSGVPAVTEDAARPQAEALVVLWRVYCVPGQRLRCVEPDSLLGDPWAAVTL